MKLKSTLSTAILMASMLATNAQAIESIQCKSWDTVKEGEIAPKFLLSVEKTTVILTHETGQTQFYGHAETSEGGFLSKTVLQLTELKTLAPGTLTIVKKTKTCGRGHCDVDGGTVITANLQFENIQTYFSCDEKAQ